jgi:hypothetical protein
MSPALVATIVGAVALAAGIGIGWILARRTIPPPPFRGAEYAHDAPSVAVVATAYAWSDDARGSIPSGPLRDRPDEWALPAYPEGPRVLPMPAIRPGVYRTGLVNDETTSQPNQVTWDPPPPPPM